MEKNLAQCFVFFLRVQILVSFEASIGFQEGNQYAHFTERKTEAQGNKVPCPKVARNLFSSTHNANDSTLTRVGFFLWSRFDG